MMRWKDSIPRTIRVSSTEFAPLLAHEQQRAWIEHTLRVAIRDVGTGETLLGDNECYGWCAEILEELEGTRLPSLVLNGSPFHCLVILGCRALRMCIAKFDEKVLERRRHVEAGRFPDGPPRPLPGAEHGSATLNQLLHDLRSLGFPVALWEKESERTAHVLPILKRINNTLGLKRDYLLDLANQALAGAELAEAKTLLGDDLREPRTDAPGDPLRWFSPEPNTARVGGLIRLLERLGVTKSAQTVSNTSAEVSWMRQVTASKELGVSKATVCKWSKNGILERHSKDTRVNYESVMRKKAEMRRGGPDTRAYEKIIRIQSDARTADGKASEFAGF